MDDGRLFLKGEWVESERTAEVRAPWDGRLLRRVAQATPAQVDAALAFALEGRSRLQAQSTGVRRAVLEGMASGLVARAQDFEDVICQEAGKPRTLARAEVRRAVEVFRLAAAELSRFGGSVVPVDFDASSAGLECEVRRFPAGVVVGIVPFNFPLNLGAHKVAPALAVGAPILIKPPPQAPSAQLFLAELAQAAGADPAALQVLPCETSVAEQLATSPKVRVLSFTGSARVGWQLKQKAPGRVLLELGGNAAVLVAADADVEWAAERCVAAGLAMRARCASKCRGCTSSARPTRPFSSVSFPTPAASPPETLPWRRRCVAQSSTTPVRGASRPGWTRRWRPVPRWPWGEKPKADSSSRRC